MEIAAPKSISRRLILCYNIISLCYNFSFDYLENHLQINIARTVYVYSLYRKPFTYSLRIRIEVVNYMDLFREVFLLVLLSFFK